MSKTWMDQAAEILEQESEMTTRQLFYRLVADGYLSRSQSDWAQLEEWVPSQRPQI
jgi:hypothetical protein